MSNQLTLKQAQLHCLINFKSKIYRKNFSYYNWLLNCETDLINKKELYNNLLNVYVIYCNKL